MSVRFDTILGESDDFEKRQYLILQGLREYTNAFSHNRLYPSLAELTELYRTLQTLIGNKDEIRKHFSRELKDIDLDNKKLVYETTEQEGEKIGAILELMIWAHPLVRDVMEEGMDIFNFVDEHINITEVGITPIYRDEGYWFVPDIRIRQLHLLRYEVSLFSSTRERYRTLKTRVIDSLDQDSESVTPENIKWMLIQKYHDLPNPATFSCDTDLDFPYGETILPVAKRKLMARLFS
jgi:hypothetical protein